MATKAGAVFDNILKEYGFCKRDRKAILTAFAQAIYEYDMLSQEDESLIDEHRIYESAISTFGANSQILMMFEEMYELQKELCKNFRGKDNKEQIAEELADVYIMLKQMIVLFGCKEAFAFYKNSKLRRLKEIIEKHGFLMQDERMKNGGDK